MLASNRDDPPIVQAAAPPGRSVTRPTATRLWPTVAAKRVSARRSNRAGQRRCDPPQAVARGAEALARNAVDAYAKYVTGSFAGTTDEVIQWAAIRRRLMPDLLRAVAAAESIGR